MIARRRMSARAKCEHVQTITVTTAGIERVVCERCGYVSFSIVEELSGSPSRDQFERPTETARSLTR